MREHDEANVEDCLYAIAHIEEYITGIRLSFIPEYIGVELSVLCQKCFHDSPLSKMVNRYTLLSSV